MLDRPRTVLIVDDEVDIRLLVRALLDSAHLDVEVVGEAGDATEALEKWEELSPPEIPDVVILDNRMPDRDGIEVAEEMLRREPDQHVLLFTAYLTAELERRAAEAGVRACIGKNDFDRLTALVTELTERS